MRLPKLLRPAKAYTLIQLLFFIGIITVISLVFFVLFNPAEKLLEGKDVRRKKDVEMLLNMIDQFRENNQGSLPPGFTTGMKERQLGTASTGCALNTSNCTVENSSCLNVENSLISVPVDPNGTEEKTGYVVSIDTNNVITVKACNTEGALSISVSR